MATTTHTPGPRGGSRVMKKTRAVAMLVDSVFDPNGSLTQEKFDCGRYRWLGSQAAHIAAAGNELDAHADRDVQAIWFERRTDGIGAYCQVMCLTANKPDPHDRYVYVDDDGEQY